MVKNLNGGNKHKSFANKANHDNDNDNIRLPTHTDEKYGIVTKILGSGMFRVSYVLDEKYQPQIQNDNDNEIETETDTQNTMSILAHIRGTMKGKNKRNNIVALNSLVLIGLRSFETVKKNADILHVYSNANSNYLLQENCHLEKLYHDINNIN